MAVGNPYVPVTITGYNVTPPTDGGEQTAANTVEWAKHKTKLGDPVKTGVDSTQTAITAALDQRLLNAIFSTATNHTVTLAQRGRLLQGSATLTFTLPAAADAKNGFELPFANIGTGVVTLDGDGTETIGGTTTVDIPPGRTLWIVCDGSNWQIAQRTSPLAPRGYIDGLTLSNNGLDATNDIDIAEGVARDAANAVDLEVSSAIGKQIDGSWATGGTPASPTGGLSSSLTITNDTWYHVILGKVSSAVEVGFDTSDTGANLVTDHSFTDTRVIGSVRRETAANKLFVQTGDRVLWTDPPFDVDVTNQSTTAVSRTLTVPPGRKVDAIMNVLINNAGSQAALYVRSPDVDDEAPDLNNPPLASILMPSTGEPAVMWMMALTDTSSAVTTRSTAASTLVSIATLGYTDPRGKND